MYPLKWKGESVNHVELFCLLVNTYLGWISQEARIQLLDSFEECSGEAWTRQRHAYHAMQDKHISRCTKPKPKPKNIAR
jgi:hypothetical protein